jgi:hypothetical protein
MSEEFIQYIWKQQLFKQRSYLASTGEKVEILQPGEQNFDAGPDFINARIKIWNTIWAGNCEVHQHASDWLKHGHNQDNAYDSVILHVVVHCDSVAKTTANRIVPTIELKFDKKLEKNYQNLLDSQQWIPCAALISQIEKFHITHWLTKLTVERLEQRTEDILRHLTFSKNNWEETFYHYLARSFGFKVNAIPFELLAQSIPYSILGKHKENLFQIEALLFGQSGLLDIPSDNYSNMLNAEYLFLQKKYALRPMPAHLWKFLRLRPSNFPTVRIAQFAALTCQSTNLFSKIIEAESVSALDSLFQLKASSYWDTHFKFGAISKLQKKNLTRESIHLLLVNAIIPFIFVYGKQKNLSNYLEKAITFLETLGPEKNSIILKWNKIGINSVKAFDTQALLQLKAQYCQQKKCLQCEIGNRLISL